MRYMRYFHVVKLKFRRFIMLNGRAIPFGILCVLSITSTVFAQSQSATDTIVEKIYQSEIRVREHVDAKVKDVETKISEIDKKVGPLSTDVKENAMSRFGMQKNRCVCSIKRFVNLPDL